DFGALMCGVADGLESGRTKLYPIGLDARPEVITRTSTLPTPFAGVRTQSRLGDTTLTEAAPTVTAPMRSDVAPGTNPEPPATRPRAMGRGERAELRRVPVGVAASARRAARCRDRHRDRAGRVCGCRDREPGGRRHVHLAGAHLDAADLDGRRAVDEAGAGH